MRCAISALAGFNASVNWASYSNVAIADLVLTDSGDHQTFNIASSDFAVKRIWDRAATWTIQTSTDGGTTWGAAAAGYTIRYVCGQVVLVAPLGGTPACRVHVGAYLPINSAANAKEWEVNPQVAKLDSTVFGSRWKSYVMGLVDASIKITQWYADSTWLVVLKQTNGDNLVVTELYTGRNSYERYVAFARLNQDDIKTAVNALIEEPLSFTSDGQVYYFAGQFA